MPKLCGTHTFMREVVAESRIQVMTALFSFLFNGNSRNFGNFDLKCESASDTEKTLMTSDIFEGPLCFLSTLYL